MREGKTQADRRERSMLGRPTCPGMLSLPLTFVKGATNQASNARPALVHLEASAGRVLLPSRPASQLDSRRPGCESGDLGGVGTCLGRTTGCSG